MKAALRDLPDWPAALNHDEAAAYTRLSEAELRRHERKGSVRFLARGAKGEKICQRIDLDRLLALIWAQESGAVIDDMEFGNDD